MSQYDILDMIDDGIPQDNNRKISQKSKGSKIPIIKHNI